MSLKEATEPIIVCPHCKRDIKLTDSLAAPLIEATKKSYETQLAKKDAEVSDRLAAVKMKEEELSAARESLDRKVAEEVERQRAKIAAEEAAKAKRVQQNELQQKDRELSELNDVLAKQNAKLQEAQNAQADVMRQKREFDDAKRELELTVEKRVQAELVTTHEKAKRDAEEQMQLKLMERDQTIASMKTQIDELKRKSEQGSQQLQGEVQELQLEAILKDKFPTDDIQPVPKGEFGGDVVHRVLGPAGQLCGAILWESKRQKNWSNGWIAKLRDDQMAAKADVAIIVSQVLPKGLETFDFVDSVWVVQPRAVLALAVVLRQSLIDLAGARKASEGQQTKMEMMYEYLVGPHFRQRVLAIYETFSAMQDQLNAERKALNSQWTKREKLIERVMLATTGMYGDLQGIAGKSLPEIEGLELKALEAPSDDETSL